MSSGCRVIRLCGSCGLPLNAYDVSAEDSSHRVTIQVVTRPVEDRRFYRSLDDFVSIRTLIGKCMIKLEDVSYAMYSLSSTLVERYHASRRGRNKHFDCTCAPSEPNANCMFHSVTLGPSPTADRSPAGRKSVTAVVRLNSD